MAIPEITDSMIEKLRLGINIDHIATIRNARGGLHPDPIRALEILEKSGTDGITAHLREDRRHINDQDIQRIKDATNLPLNFEMAATEEMLKIALKVKPNACCIVPEKRTEVTTEGGLNIAGKDNSIRPLISKLQDAGIKVSLFLDADERQIIAAKQAGADIIELHTGSYCHAIDAARDKELQKIINAAKIVQEVGIECHAGHGLCYETTPAIAAIKNIVELNIGHFLIGEAIFVGLEQSVSKMRKVMDAARR